MSVLEWDKTGERRYETGVSKGVLYRQDAFGQYVTGEAWNGLTAVNESPSGAEASPQYADNIKYLNLYSSEEFNGTIEAYTYPDSFAECDGTAVPIPGIAVGQQSRKGFGLSYQTRVGNDIDGVDYGYKIHLVWGAMASPSEKNFATINDSPEAMTLSWEFSTTAVDAGPGLKPTATLTIDSTKVDADALKDLEDIIYGTAGTNARLPLPAEVLALFSGTVVTVTPTVPTFVEATGVITIPSVTGVVYKVAGAPVTGTYTVASGKTVLVTAQPTKGYVFPANTDDDWAYTRP